VSVALLAKLLLRESFRSDLFEALDFGEDFLPDVADGCFDRAEGLLILLLCSFGARLRDLFVGLLAFHVLCVEVLQS
jgi:hypothetical protein